jgi:phenylacetate-CoA oxygenase PaaJ subunit
MAYVPELFEDDAVDAAAVASGLGPAWSELHEPWLAEMREVLGEAGLTPPALTFRSTGKSGRTASTWATCWPRCSICSAPTPEARGDLRHGMARTEAAWSALNEVLDPEVPALSVVDLGLVRDVIEHEDGLEIVLTPTYSGCPATEVIEQSVLDAIAAAGLGPARVTMRRAPGLEQRLDQRRGRRKLLDYGIAPPGPVPPMAHSRSASSAAAPPPCPVRAAPARAPSAVGLRLHRLQIPAPLPRLPRALRTLQADMSTLFHDCGQVHRARHRRGQHPEFRRAPRTARDLRLHPGPVPDAARHYRRPGPAPLVLNLRRR